jgi:protein-disulfide isomerase-like protein with CxxC motif
VKDVLRRLAAVAEKAGLAFDQNTRAMLLSARTAYLDLNPTAVKITSTAVKGRVVDL